MGSSSFGFRFDFGIDFGFKFIFDFGFDFGDRGNWSSHHHHHHSCYDEQVAWAQRLLNRLGYSAGCVDGVLGDQTRRALIRYQCEHGLSHTGWLDSRTVCMLRDE